MRKVPGTWEECRFQAGGRQLQVCQGSMRHVGKAGRLLQLKLQAHAAEEAPFAWN